MSDLTTAQVRRVYSLAPVDLSAFGCPNRNPDPGFAGAQFDAWLAAHDAEVKANGWDEAITAAADVLDAGLSLEYVDNPYGPTGGDLS